MYATIFELPSQVTASLDEKDAKVWMDVYNKLNPKTAEEVRNAKKKAWYACRELPSSFSFRIKASMDMVDKDNELIDLDSVKEHIDPFIDYGGDVVFEHGDYHVGAVWDWAPIKSDGVDGIEVMGNLFGGDIVYDNMREQFVRGMNSMSLAGEAGHGKYECDDRGCYTRRPVKQLLEISICKVPANKGCTMTWYNDKAKLTKSANNFNFKADVCEIHKTYKECPILMLKKALTDAGFRVNATEAGVRMELSDMMFEQSIPFFKSNNLHYIRIGNAVYLNSRGSLAETAFKKGLSEGYIDFDGRVNEKITKSDFKNLMECGLLEDEEGDIFISF